MADKGSGFAIGLVLGAAVGVTLGGPTLTYREGTPPMPQEFCPRLDWLLAAHELVLDRPRGTAHPRFPDLIFPLDYGYLAGTSGGDGGGIDVWRGSAEHLDLAAIVCTVDMLKHDAEYKLVVGATEDDLRTIETFHNGRYVSAILVRRPD